MWYLENILPRSPVLDVFSPLHDPAFADLLASRLADRGRCSLVPDRQVHGGRGALGDQGHCRFWYTVLGLEWGLSPVRIQIAPIFHYPNALHNFQKYRAFFNWWPLYCQKSRTIPVQNLDFDKSQSIRTAHSWDWLRTWVNEKLLQFGYEPGSGEDEACHRPWFERGWIERTDLWRHWSAASCRGQE